MNILYLVTGGTGQQGGAVIKHLLKNKFKIRVLTRNSNQTRAASLSKQGIEIIEGDFDNIASIKKSLKGVNAVFSLQNWAIAGIRQAYKQSKLFADLAKEENIEHFVYSSSAGSQLKSGVPHIENNGHSEDYIKKIGLPYTFLRPVSFMENWLLFKQSISHGQIAFPLSPNTLLQQIAVDDIGAFAAMVFSNPLAWKYKSLEIAGDELTMNEIAETFSKSLNKHIHYRQIPWEAFEKQVGEEITLMFRWYEEKGGYNANRNELISNYPWLTKLSDYLRMDFKL